MNKKEIFSQIEKIYNSRKNKPTLQELDTIIKLCNLGLKETIDEEIIFERGFAFKKKGNLESALRDLKNVINLDPNASINHEMGEIYHQQKEYEKALEFYKKELDKYLPAEWSEVVYSGNNNDSELLKEFTHKEDKEKEIRRDFIKFGSNPKILIVYL